MTRTLVALGTICLLGSTLVEFARCQTQTQPDVVLAGGKVPIPRLLRKVEPQWPTKTFSAGQYKEHAVVRVLLKQDGTISTVTILRSTGAKEVDDAVTKAVKQWRYESFRLSSIEKMLAFTIMVAPDFRI